MKHLENTGTVYLKIQFMKKIPPTASRIFPQIAPPRISSIFNYLIITSIVSSALISFSAFVLLVKVTGKFLISHSGQNSVLRSIQQYVSSMICSP